MSVISLALAARLMFDHGEPILWVVAYHRDEEDEDAAEEQARYEAELASNSSRSRRSDLIRTRMDESEEEDGEQLYRVVQSERRQPVRQSPQPSKPLSAEDLRKGKAARNKFHLGEELVDNEKLVVSLAFYPHHLQPGKAIPAGPIEDFVRQKKGFRPYAKAARRVLHVFSVWDKPTRERLLRLPTESGIYSRLASVGLNLRIPSERKQFEQLNGDLEIDQLVKEYAARHQELLSRVRSFLRKSYVPSKEELLQQLGGPHPPRQPVAYIGGPAEPEPTQFPDASLGAMLKRQHGY